MYKEHEVYRDSDFAAFLYETPDNVVQVHLEVYKPITHRVYRTLVNEFNEMVGTLCKIGLPSLHTACHEDEKDIALIERFGFEYVSSTYEGVDRPLLIYELDLTDGD